MKRALGLAALTLCIVYVCDDLSLRFRIPNNREPFGAVRIKRYYAIPLKGNKTEFVPAEPETQRCVHSLFPHFGAGPCWYVGRETHKQIDM